MSGKKIKHPLSYQSAGVDIAAGNALVEKIKPFCERTRRPEVIAGPGGFAGLFKLNSSAYKNPVLVSATDGVGTKLKLAQMTAQHTTIGIDLVAMCVNDVLTHGAEPLLFLDYFACGKLQIEQASDVIQGIADGCELAGCTLIGGETAEMPGMYEKDNYDIAGFCVGIAEEDKLCGAHRVEVGDMIIGIASNGVHSNGFSLVHSIVQQSGANLDMLIAGKPLSEVLLAPTHIYVQSLLPLIQQNKIHALAHITGGGITENLPRVLQDGQIAQVNVQCWQRPEIFHWLQQQGKVDETEMLKVFNCGLGMLAIVDAKDSDCVIQHLQQQGFDAWLIGHVADNKNQIESDERVIYSGYE